MKMCNDWVHIYSFIFLFSICQIITYAACDVHFVNLIEPKILHSTWRHMWPFFQVFPYTGQFSRWIKLFIVWKTYCDYHFWLKWACCHRLDLQNYTIIYFDCIAIRTWIIVWKRLFYKKKVFTYNLMMKWKKCTSIDGATRIISREIIMKIYIQILLVMKTRK